MRKLLNKFDDKLREVNDADVVCFTTVLIFLHYTLSIIGLTLLFLFIIFYRTKKVFNHKSSYIILAFAVTSVGAAIFYRNYLGLIAGMGAIAILLIGQYLRTVMTKELAEKSLTVACRIFPYTAVYAIIEFIYVRLLYIDNGHGGRAASVFFNPNYYGTICAIMIVIALYKLLSGNLKKPIYYITAMSSLIGLVLCMSVFSLMEAAIGIALILFYMKRRYLLASYLALVILSCLIVYFIPELFTRLTDIFSTLSQRVRIWRLSFIEITEAPLFGKGAMTYNLISPEFKGELGFSVYVNYHAHNILLDSLINYGFVGTGLILYFFVSIAQKAKCCKIGIRDTDMSGLIKAVFIAMIVHSMVDITFFWIQTGLLYMIIFSFLGALDKLPDTGKIEIEQNTKVIDNKQLQDS